MLGPTFMPSGSCLLYQLLTGRRPHEENGRIIPVRRMTEPSPSPRILDPGILLVLASLIERMLSVDPRTRPNAVTVLHVVEDLAGGSHAHASGTESDPPYPNPSPEDLEVVASAKALLERYVIDATREAVAVPETREDDGCVDGTALLSRALLRLWVQVGGRDDGILLRAEEMALRSLSRDPTNATVHWRSPPSNTSSARTKRLCARRGGSSSFTRTSARLTPVARRSSSDFSTRASRTSSMQRASHLRQSSGGSTSYVSGRSRARMPCPPGETSTPSARASDWSRRARSDALFVRVPKRRARRRSGP